VRLLMVHAADQHALAEVVLVGADAHRAARLRETAVGRDQERCFQAQAVAQRDAGLVVGRADRVDPRAVEQVQAGQVTHGFPCRFADVVVRHQHAQRRLAGQFGIDAHVAQAIALHHARGA
jgi:hypothetical protein